MKKQKRFVPTSRELAKPAFNLIDAREKRAKSLKKAIGITSGGVFGTKVISNAFLNDVSIKYGFTNPAFIGGLFFTANALVAGAVFKKHSPEIKKATNNLAHALSNESKSNTQLRNFLGAHKYIFVNRKGQIVGTNRDRIFGIGRLRIRTSEILKN